ncbi:hypothetical protein BLNAU_22807 [Blattamonas nauphoetae]|uniref:Uncharacterized protein n=1 Tax=Blattamonas nauphoetae TaxID=2049346 RepID=A0ABQ9WW73_9EUKA|nr:hypothetical protein BLNAU_22807 [Blattamonas nauphoetae]
MVPITAEIRHETKSRASEPRLIVSAINAMCIRSCCRQCSPLPSTKSTKQGGDGVVPLNSSDGAMKAAIIRAEAYDDKFSGSGLDDSTKEMRHHNLGESGLIPVPLGENVVLYDAPLFDDKRVDTVSVLDCSYSVSTASGQ